MRKKAIWLLAVLWPVFLLASEGPAPGGTAILAVNVSGTAFQAVNEHGQDARATEVTITIRTEAISNNAQVLLGEIATVTCDAPELAARMAAVQVGCAAPPGQIRSFNYGDISMALHRAGFAQTLALKGPRDIKVTATAQTVSGQTLAEAASAAVCKKFQNDPDLEVAAEVTAVPSDLTLRLGETKLEPDVGDNLHPGQQTIHVAVMQGGRRVADVMVSLRLRVTGTIQVAAEHILSGDPLTSSLIKKVRKDLTYNDLQNRCDAAKLVGLRARSVVSAEQTLTKDLFALPYLIRRGDAVTISVRHGGLEIYTTGEARGDAAVDEAVHLLLDNGREVIARATGTREASVDDNSRL